MNHPFTRPSRCLAGFLTGLGCAALTLFPALSQAADTRASKSAPSPVPVPLPEARRLVRMMDDIYGAGVLTTHRMYVQEPGIPAAVTWAKQVFEKVKGRGWPEARIFASTDRTLNPENRMVDTFEQEAVREFEAGKTTFEKVDGNTLRFASEIRMVDRSCLTCHVRNKVGDLVGGVSYRMPLAASRGPAIPAARRARR